MFSDCGGSVVADETIARHVAMIEDGPRPVEGSVAVGALVGARDVRRRLGGREPTRVACLALGSNGRVVHPRRLEKSRGMAVAARRLDRNMSGRGQRFCTSPTASMARAALGRRAHELSADMASTTWRAHVLPGKWESRLVVIESGSHRLRRRRAREQHEPDQQDRGKHHDRRES